MRLVDYRRRKSNYPRSEAERDNETREHSEELS